MGKLLKRMDIIMRPDLSRPRQPRDVTGSQAPVRRHAIKTADEAGRYFFAVAPEADEPSVAELAGNFGAAISKWAEAGLPVVTAEQYAVRAAACEACELWDGAARFGLGKCKAPGCGCTKFKRWLATEACKHPKGPRWPEIYKPAADTADEAPRSPAGQGPDTPRESPGP